MNQDMDPDILIKLCAVMYRDPLNFYFIPIPGTLYIYGKK